MAKKHALKLHMPGAGLANAVAHFGFSPAEISRTVGVDVMCLREGQNGLPVGQAEVFFDQALAQDFASRVKHSGQLTSNRLSMALLARTTTSKASPACTR
jgi:threonine aldolase